jgi:protein TonB
MLNPFFTTTMKIKQLLFFGLLLSASGTFAQSDTLEKIYTSVDEEASFPGGNKAMSDYIHKRLLYPQAAIVNDIEGTCLLQLIVQKDGSIANVTVERGVAGCPECDQQAISLVQRMPKWEPAKNKGYQVGSLVKIPVRFSLTD